MHVALLTLLPLARVYAACEREPLLPHCICTVQPLRSCSKLEAAAAERKSQLAALQPSASLLPSPTQSLQDIALLDARRGCTMFRKVDVPILGEQPV